VRVLVTAACKRNSGGMVRESGKNPEIFGPICEYKDTHSVSRYTPTNAFRQLAKMLWHSTTFPFC
jgi:hypothetical protein